MSTGRRPFSFGRARRLVLAAILLLILLQFARVGLLAGGLTGSLAAGVVRLLDVFAFLESLAAARGVAAVAVTAVLPVAALYLVFGRAFCGWACPMDYLFELVARARQGRGRAVRLSAWTGYGVAAALLAASALVGIPLFSNYLSHLTNFFRALTAGHAMLAGLGATLTLLGWSAGVIVLLLALEAFFPRLWCRALCPVGRTYGLFNRASLLRLRFSGGACTACHRCDQACYMGVEIERRTDRAGLRDANCIYCGRCVEACRGQGGPVGMGFGGKG